MEALCELHTGSQPGCALESPGARTPCRDPLLEPGATGPVSLKSSPGEVCMFRAGSRE